MVLVIMTWNVNTYAEGEGLIETRPYQYYVHLAAHGDYSKLKQIIRSAKNEYFRGEPIMIAFSIRNDSKDIVHIHNILPAYKSIFLWKMINSRQETVQYTTVGKEVVLKMEKEKDIGFSVASYNGKHFYKLQPEEEILLSNSIELTYIFDLSLPDEYQLTCPQINFMDNQKYDPPLLSNTLTFRILDIPFNRNESTGRSVSRRIMNIVSFANPPRGKEIFEQKEEPKNIFYNPDTDIKETIDISPYTYFLQRAEKK
jgi:hypothetical protein